MVMPIPILCDFLEDKGIDCRLLRTQKPGGISLCNPNMGSNSNSGYGWSYGWFDGDSGSFRDNVRACNACYHGGGFGDGWPNNKYWEDNSENGNGNGHGHGLRDGDGVNWE